MMTRIFENKFLTNTIISVWYTQVSPVENLIVVCHPVEIPLNILSQYLIYV